MAQAAASKTFVLAHGAWHGGWCWKRVGPAFPKHFAHQSPTHQNPDFTMLSQG